MPPTTPSRLTPKTTPSKRPAAAVTSPASGGIVAAASPGVSNMNRDATVTTPNRTTPTTTALAMTSPSPSSPGGGHGHHHHHHHHHGGVAAFELIQMVAAAAKDPAFSWIADLKFGSGKTREILVEKRITNDVVSQYASMEAIQAIDPPLPIRDREKVLAAAEAVLEEELKEERKFQRSQAGARKMIEDQELAARRSVVEAEETQLRKEMLEEKKAEHAMVVANRWLIETSAPHQGVTVKPDGTVTASGDVLCHTWATLITTEPLSKKRAMFGRNNSFGFKIVKNTFSVAIGIVPRSSVERNWRLLDKDCALHNTLPPYPIMGGWSLFVDLRGNFCRWYGEGWSSSSSSDDVSSSSCSAPFMLLDGDYVLVEVDFSEDSPIVTFKSGFCNDKNRILANLSEAAKQKQQLKDQQMRLKAPVSATALQKKRAQERQQQEEADHNSVLQLLPPRQNVAVRRRLGPEFSCDEEYFPACSIRGLGTSVRLL